jgi:flagellum-specific peptidoglycan hydrolase FlgJ
LNTSQLSFLAQVVTPARDSEREYGIPAAVTIAQAIIESTAKVGATWTWGGSTLFWLHNNPFGMKFAKWMEAHGATPQFKETQEIVQGEAVTIKDAFAHFPDLATAFRVHALLFRKPHYASAMAALQSGDAAAAPWLRFAQQLGPDHCGYSTNPRYAAMIANFVGQYRLDDPRALDWYASGKDPKLGGAA